MDAYVNVVVLSRLIKKRDLIGKSQIRNAFSIQAGEWLTA